MSFPVNYNNQKYYVDFNHKPTLGTTCCIWQVIDKQERLIAYGKTVIQQPDVLNKLFGRKKSLGRALDKLYSKVADRMPRSDFKAFRAAVYNAMFERSKIHEHDGRFKNGHKNGFNPFIKGIKLGVTGATGVTNGNLY